MLTQIGDKYKIGKRYFAKFQCECSKIVEFACTDVKCKRKKSCGCKATIKLNVDKKLYNIYRHLKFKGEVCHTFTYEVFCDFLKQNNYTYDKFIYRIDNTKPFSVTNLQILDNKPAFHNIDKSKETQIKKYGMLYIHTEDYKRKKKETCINKYGCEHPAQNEDVKQKTRNTINQKIIDNPRYYKEIYAKNKNTKLQRYGMEYFPLINRGRPIKNGPEQGKFGKFLLTISDDFKSNYTILNGKEIDFLSEKLKVGFEYCGIYWHTDKSKEIRDKSYHYNKFIQCNNKGYRLFTIWSTEWNTKRPQIEGYINSALGINNKKIFARKCDVRPIDRSLGREFIDKYHIQGQQRIGKFYAGCYYNDELVGCISLNSHHRNSKELVLDRLVFKIGISVAGGASKMFNLCEKYAIANNYSKITTWSDNRWSEGKIYGILGFELDADLRPDYTYVDLKNPKIIISKQSMKGKNCDNLAKLWDCGKKRWVKKLGP